MDFNIITAKKEDIILICFCEKNNIKTGIGILNKAIHKDTALIFDYQTIEHFQLRFLYHLAYDFLYVYEFPFCPIYMETYSLL